MSARNLIKNGDVLAGMLPEHLRDLFGAFITTLKVVAAEAEPSAAAPSGLVLDYKAKVSPSAWGIFEEKVPLLYLAGKLKDLEASEKAAAMVLDLSCNNLSGDDIPTVVQCVEALRPVSGGVKGTEGRGNDAPPHPSCCTEPHRHFPLAPLS
jgi:hypothetical protein